MKYKKLSFDFSSVPIESKLAQDAKIIQQQYNDDPEVFISQYQNHPDFKDRPGAFRFLQIMLWSNDPEKYENAIRNELYQSIPMLGEKEDKILNE